MSELYLYGEIYGGVESFAADWLEGQNSPTIRLNSAGGNIFTALAIYNLLKSRGDVEIIIDGLAASAASVLICGAKTVKAARNSLLMLHNPAVVLDSDLYSLEEITKLKNSLDAIKESILTTYETKIKIGRNKLSKMLDSETWLTAEDAAELGLIDEIIEVDADIKVDAAQKFLFVNNVGVSLKNFGKLPQGVTKMENKTENTAIFDSYKNSVLAAERLRVQNLNALKGDNAEINAVIDAAITKGDELAQVQPYVDAIKSVAKAPVDFETHFKKLYDLIEDNLKSGAEGVGGTNPPASEAEKQKARAQMIADFANQMTGGVKNGK